MGCILCTTLCFRSCVLFFHNKHAQSTSLGPKLSFYVVSHDSVAGRYPLCIVFLQRTCPIHFFRPKTKFLGVIARFRCGEVPVVRSGDGVHIMHHFMLPKLCLVFWQRTCPIQLFWPKTKFLGGFARFRCWEVPVVKSGFGVHTMHHFVLPKLRLVFRNEHAQSTSLGLKLSFWVVSCDSVAGRYLL